MHPGPELRRPHLLLKLPAASLAPPWDTPSICVPISTAGSAPEPNPNNSHNNSPTRPGSMTVGGVS